MCHDSVLQYRTVSSLFSIYLSGIIPDGANRLIQEPAASVGLGVTEDELASVRPMAGLLPFFLQATAGQ